MNSIDSLSKVSLHLDNKNEGIKPSSFSTTDSSHESNQKIQKYIFESNNKTFAVYLILNEEKIKIKADIIPEGKDLYFYEKEITQENLKKISRVFKLLDYIEESFEYFNELFSDKQNKIIVKEEKDILFLEKKFKLSFPLKIELTKKLIQNDNDKIVQNNDLLNNNFIEKKELIQNNEEIKEGINQNEDKEKEDITQLNITKEKLINENSKNHLHDDLDDNKEEKDVIQLHEEELEEEDEAKKAEEENSKKSLINIPKVKSRNNLKEDKSQNRSSLLNKKRTNNSDLSDASFNSISNENDYGNNNNKKQKNNLVKDSLFKIFSENASHNSGESNEKFFTKIQKNLDLEKNKKKDLNNMNEVQDKNNSEFNNKDKRYIEENLLYGDDDSSEYIKDDLDLLSNKSNKSPTITPIGGKINNNSELNDNNFKLQLMNKNNYNDPDYSKKFFDENSIYKNFNRCITGVQNIQIKDGIKDSNININEEYQNNNINKIGDKISLDIGPRSYSNNAIYDKNSFNKLSKFNKTDKSYYIIHKNNVEHCTTEISYLFQDDLNNSYNSALSMESNIILNYSEFDFIINYLKKKFNKEIKKGIHIYQASEDGATAQDFHRICDGNTNILVLIKTKDGKKFGGYTSVGFSSFNKSYYDDTAFIFSIDKREIYPNIHGKTAVDSFYNIGPSFSGDTIKIFDNFLINGGITTIMSGNFEMNEDYQITNGKKTFEVEEIEVLEFIEMKNHE